MAPAAMIEQQGEGRWVVKHTFLSFVDAEDEQPGRVPRSKTDSVLRPGHGGNPGFGWQPGTPSTVPSEGSEDEEGQRQGEEDEAVYSSADSVEAGAEESASSSAAAAAAPWRQEDVAEAPQVPQGCRDRRTTLMMRNLPNNYTRDMLVQLLDREGFAGSYDFVYLPVDFARGCGLGYAFVNLVDASLVTKFKCCFDAFSNWKLRTTKVCQVTFSDRDQGLKANIKRYRNSPVMHPSVSDEFKPCLFSDGVRVPFPAPNRSLRKPTKKA